MNKKTGIFLILSFLALSWCLMSGQVQIRPPWTNQGAWLDSPMLYASAGPDFFLRKIEQRDGLAFPTPSGLLGGTCWARIYLVDKVRQNSPRAIVQAHDGGFLVSGESGQNSVYEPWLMKLDSGGSLEWVRSTSSLINSLARTFDGKYVGLGSVGSGNSADLLVSKFDENGTVSWAFTYGGSGADTPGVGVIRATKDGGYIVAATSASFSGNSSNDTWLLKLSSTGGIEWERSMGGTLADSGRFVIETGDGGYFVAAETYSFSQGINDTWFLKLNSSGVIQWQKSMGTYDGNESPSCAVVTPDGGYLVSGWTNGVTRTADAWLVRLTSSGSVVWQKTFGGDWGESTNFITPTDDGNYLVTAAESSWPLREPGFWAFKISPAGNILWQRAYVGKSIVASLKTFDGEFVIAGAKGVNAINAIQDIIIYKISAAGDVTANCDLTKPTVAQVIETSFTPMNTTASESATSASVASASMTFTSDLTMVVRDPCLTYVEEPEPPQGLAVESKINRGVFKGEVVNTLTWSTSSGNPRAKIMEYRIYRKVAGQSDTSYQKVGQVTGAAYQYEDKVQTQKEKYVYALSAVSETGVESQKSAPVSS